MDQNRERIPGVIAACVLRSRSPNESVTSLLLHHREVIGGYLIALDVFSFISTLKVLSSSPLHVARSDLRVNQLIQVRLILVFMFNARLVGWIC